MPNNITTICPVCDSKTTKNIWSEINSTKAANYFCPPSRSEELNKKYKASIEKLWNSPNAMVLECTDCNFAFGYPHVGGDEEFYTIDNEFKGYSKWKWDYNNAIENYLYSISDKKYKILDIGAGDGLFLDRLANNIFDKYALEGSEITRKFLKNKGINVIDSLENAIKNDSNSFDFVVMFQVLEHISDFDGFLKSINLLLKKDGTLIISVPNIDSIKVQEKYLPGVDMIPNHINKWGLQSLEIALLKHNFKIKKTALEPTGGFRSIISLLHIAIKLDATKPESIASKVYSIKNRSLRKFGLGILAIPKFFQLIPLFFQLRNPNIILRSNKIN